MDNFLDANRQLWNAKTDVHLGSDFYDLEGFKKGRSSLNDIELEQLGDVRGKRLLHLQCHFGQDTLSLARMGAEATGLDLSDRAIVAARQLADELNLSARFVISNVLEADQALAGEQFDIIFTSYGVIGWLPDLKPWGQVIGKLLRPGGEFHLIEFHPVVWMFDDRFESIAYSYFNTEPIIEETEGSYADRTAPIKNLSYSWNHPLSESITALLDAGLQLTSLREFDYSPYDCFNETVPVTKGYQISGLEGKLPMVFALKAVKPM